MVHSSRGRGLRETFVFLEGIYNVILNASGFSSGSQVLMCLLICY
jgi:hypothetical protein